MKICCKCKVEKEPALFRIDKRSKRGLTSWCKQCLIEYQADPKRREAKNLYDRSRVYDPKVRLARKVARDKRKAEIARQSAEWRAANRGRARAISRASQARRRSIYKDGMGAVELLEWEARQIKACRWCDYDCSNGYEIDHVMPLILGGAHEAWNLVIACGPCNKLKNAKHPLDWLAELGYDPGGTRLG